MSPSRVEKLKEELGAIVKPKKEEIKKATIKEFLEHVERVVIALGSINTHTWNTKTAIFALALYMKPPSLAFVRAKVKDLRGEVKVIASERQHTITFDELFEIIGASYHKRKYNAPRMLVNYIPISYDYYVVPKEISENWSYKVMSKEMSWYVYKSKSPAVLENISHILNMNI